MESINDEDIIYISTLYLSEYPSYIKANFTVLFTDFIIFNIINIICFIIGWLLFKKNYFKIMK